MKSKLSISALLCLSLFVAGAHAVSAQQVQPLDPEWIQKMYAEGWHKVQEGVLQRERGGGEPETFSYGSEGLQWVLRGHQLRLDVLEERFDQAPTKRLLELIEQLRGEISRLNKAFEEAPSVDRFDNETMTTCVPSFGGSAQATPPEETWGVEAASSAWFQNDCGHLGDTFATAYAHAIEGTEDVDDYLGLGGGLKRPPEPLFFRANSDSCISFWLTNLVPLEYQLDDVQVRTPTDILGQHIHLVKFDVTASDGAANGFNYEDGSFSPGEVRERIRAIRAFNNCTASDFRNGTFNCPVYENHPFFGAGPDEDGDGTGDWVGAQTTIQSWFADQTKDNAGNDRTVRTAFTHDHFGPSTHQQAGLYAGLVVEPKGSVWYHNETG